MQLFTISFGSLNLTPIVEHFILGAATHNVSTVTDKVYE